MTNPPPQSAEPNIEIEKRLRGLYGTWKVLEVLQKEYPSGIMMLMDSSASFDILVIDHIRGEIIAVEVKATRPTSASSRSLSPSQKELKRLLESRDQWKVRMEKYVMYGDPGTEAAVKKVP
jgi:hypothetical protein